MSLLFLFSFQNNIIQTKRLENPKNMKILAYLHQKQDVLSLKHAQVCLSSTRLRTDSFDFQTLIHRLSVTRQDI